MNRTSFFAIFGVAGLMLTCFSLIGSGGSAISQVNAQQPVTVKYEYRVVAFEIEEGKLTNSKDQTEKVQALADDGWEYVGPVTMIQGPRNAFSTILFRKLKK